MEKISTFRDRLIEAMDKRHMRITDLEEASGIEKSRICYYRKGRNGPKHEAAEAMAKALDVDINWLLGYDVPMKPQRKISFAEKFDLLNEVGKQKAEEYVDLII